MNLLRLCLPMLVGTAPAWLLGSILCSTHKPMPEACAHSFFFFEVLGLNPRPTAYLASTLSELSVQALHPFVPLLLICFTSEFKATVLPLHCFFLCLPCLSLWSCLLFPPDFSFYHVSHLSLLCGRSLTTATHFITNCPAILPEGSRLSIGMAPVWSGMESPAWQRPQLTGVLAELLWYLGCPPALSSELPAPHSSPVFASQPCSLKPFQTQSLPGAQQFGPAAPVQL